ncbi:MAG: HAMP domain-containing histidine kinase [Deltaproteobacteria bacterium]|nr:HAMP domain-containing histidine kinase [Deltaproteobacteria bacterium]MBW2070264.1 HAMP domain-containing histidine kinase [Deltaproteobacteria bacterium]
MVQSQLENVREKIRKKKENYTNYNFKRLQEEAFATFFDLAQEYTSLDNLYLVCTLVPKEFFGVDSRLYLVDDENDTLRIVCSSIKGLDDACKPDAPEIKIHNEPYFIGESYVIPIRGNKALSDLLPIQQFKQIIGMFELFPSDKISDQERFFLEKFTNRIGYNLHQKQLIHQNLHHIKFINQLVADIEHNVISPNIYYRLFLKKLQKCIDENRRIKEKVHELVSFCPEIDNKTCAKLRDIYNSIGDNTEALLDAAKEMERHYEHTSLYLETLLRREHFRRGTYVLRKQRCNFKTEIIEPILARYRHRLEQKNIKIDNRLEDVPDELLELVVDKGLLAQVYDNFFSNAAKYTQEIVDNYGSRVKFVSYGKRILKDYFGRGVDGIKFSVFTTGKPIPAAEVARLFDEGYRRPGSDLEVGSGHGLHFVRHIIEIHGGEVGVDPQKYGNSFFFILPLRRNQIGMSAGVAV